METDRLVDKLFNLIRQKGQRAIAYSNDETVRLELLSLLEAITDLEVQIHKAINDNPISKVLISDSQELSEEIMSELGPVTEFVDMKSMEGTVDLTSGKDMTVYKMFKVDSE